MSNEYDYSGLYNNGQGGNTPDPNQGQNNNQPRNEANQASATQPDQPSQPEQGGYPNVGSSGMNTANTARTDYSAGSSTNNTGANTYNQPNNAYGQNNGYTSSFSGGNGGSNRGYNGYSYASAPQQPPKKEKKHNKVLLRVLAGVGAVALGFGGGIGAPFDGVCDIVIGPLQVFPCEPPTDGSDFLSRIHLISCIPVLYFARMPRDSSSDIKHDRAVFSQIQRETRLRFRNFRNLPAG